ncbi:MAG TPA: hypothetical protein VJT70_07430 [Sphingomicrobium sp.]|nr:hypothetical protein [Sphingomicrobium sp.]
MMRTAVAVLGLATTVPAAAQQPAPAPAKPAAPCAAPEHRQFDFWVGRWDVYPTGKDKLVAHSLIESVYNGCGVRENWMPLSNQPGGSLNIYVPEQKRWEQFWIDSQGSRAIFTGGWNGKAMVIQGKWAGPLVRISYTKNADGSVRQFGEQSTDEGKNWAPSFDLTYRPAAASKP